MCCGPKTKRDRRTRQANTVLPTIELQPKPRSNPDSDIATRAVNAALRYSSSSEEHNRQSINNEVLDRAGVPPPSYDDVMKGPAAGGSSSTLAGGASHKKDNTVAANNGMEPINGEPFPDDVTSFSEDPQMFTPPTTRAPTVVGNNEYDVDSVLENVQTRGSRDSSRSSRRVDRAARKDERRNSKDQYKAEKAAKKAEKWAERAVNRGYVFEGRTSWFGTGAQRESAGDAIV